MIITKKYILLFVIGIIAGNNLLSQTAEFETEGSGAYKKDMNIECITQSQYYWIEKRCDDNVLAIGLNPLTSRDASAVSLQWPLRTASGVNDCSYYFISAYVDQDTVSGSFKDYNCSNVSYDGHKGTDIVPWPYPMTRMDKDELEVIAAEAGTIIDKLDGQFDRQCSNSNSLANYVVIQHADGTRALYYHLKKNSVTTKSVGQTVSVGELLGTVGSSGNSSGPHLHFELRTGSGVNTYKDPYSGSCNLLNSNSWWASQKNHVEPAVVKATVNKAPPVVPGCPTTETPNDTNCFQPGVLAYFLIFMRNETAGSSINMKILRSNGTTVSSWSHNVTSNVLATWRWFSRTLPGAPGIYTFEVTYNNTVCTSTFEVSCSAAVGLSYLPAEQPFRIYPNPSSGQFIIEPEHETASDTKLYIYNLLNQRIYASELIGKTPVNLDVQSGTYFYHIVDKNVTVQSGKLTVY